MICHRLNTEERLSRTIETLYDAALDSALWPKAMHHIAELGDGVAAFCADLADGQLTGIVYHGLEARGLETYGRDFAHIDPRTEYGARQPPLTPYVDYDFISERELDQHSFYMDFLRQHDMRYMIGARLPASAGTLRLFAIQRSARAGHVDAIEVELFKRIIPHLDKALQIAGRLCAVNLQAQYLLDTLNMSSDAVFLVRPDGRLANANIRGEKLLRGGDGLAYSHGRLVACHMGTNQELHRLLAPGADAETVRGCISTAFQITRPSGKAPLQALIAPLPKRQQLLLSCATDHESLAVMIVVDPAKRPVPQSEHLAVFYGFTPAEANLAAALAQGETLSDYAECKELSIHTVRWMLKQLQSKTDTRRLPELVRLLTAGPTLSGNTA